MVTGRLREDSRSVHHTPALGILGAEPQRLEPRGHRQQFWAQKALGAPRPKARVSELNKLIDDYIEWNQSCSDIEPDRPGSSGTLFVDFVENGDMEVSYRNGVNKKLPSPPLPPQFPTPASLTSLRRRYKAEQISESKVGCKPVPSLPSQSARHDSVISSRAANAERIDPSFIPPAQPQPSFPLPKITSRAPRPAPGRKLYPPQVHQTQRAPSQLPIARHSSPAPSQTSTASFHTARSQRNREACINLPAPSFTTAAAASASAQKPSPSSSPRKPKRHMRSNTPSTTAVMPAAHAQRSGEPPNHVERRILAQPELELGHIARSDLGLEGQLLLRESVLLTKGTNHLIEPLGCHPCERLV